MGTKIIALIALYFVVKWAVKNGMMEVHEEIEEKEDGIEGGIED